MTTFSVFAQNSEQSKNVLQNLTIEQKAMLKEQQLFIDKSKEDFKQGLSAEQISILKNKNLSRIERSKLLKASLSKQQRSFIDKNKNLLRDKRVNFKKSLTRGQVTRLRRLSIDRDINDRQRLARRLRRLIRDNLNTDNI
jgi:hypothetical protein